MPASLGKPAGSEAREEPVEVGLVLDRPAGGLGDDGGTGGADQVDEGVRVDLPCPEALTEQARRLCDRLLVGVPDQEAAWYQAVRNARELICAESAIGCPWEGQWVQIEDDSGMPIDRIPLDEIARYAGGV